MITHSELAGILVDGANRYDVYFDTTEWAATMDWARFHGLDPMLIPAGSVIERDGAGRRILYESFVPTGPKPGDIQMQGDFEPVIVHQVERGEGILPLPVEVTG